VSCKILTPFRGFSAHLSILHVSHEDDEIQRAEWHAYVDSPVQDRQLLTFKNAFSAKTLHGLQTPMVFCGDMWCSKKSRYRRRHAKPSAATQHTYKQQRETAALLGSSTPFYFQTWRFIPPKLNIPESQTGLSPTAPRRRCTTPTTTQLCSPLYLPPGRPLLVPRQTLSDEDTYLVPPTPSTPSRGGLSSHMPWRSGSRRPAVLFLA
jgi:hypothetical protein